MPSSTYTGESPDISLYDHLKITAAVGACISRYLLDQGAADIRTRVFQNEKAFRDEQVFALYTADLSGIQKFIYTVATQGRAEVASQPLVFLEMLMEHYADEVLQACGLSRVNLIYSGGGHCYLLAPYAKAAFGGADGERPDKRLADRSIRTALFVAHGWSACSANDLTNTPAESTVQGRFQPRFRAVSRRQSSADIERNRFAD